MAPCPDRLKIYKKADQKRQVQNLNFKILTGTDHDVECELIERVLFIRVAGAEAERGH